MAKQRNLTNNAPQPPPAPVPIAIPDLSNLSLLGDEALQNKKLAYLLAYAETGSVGGAMRLMGTNDRTKHWEWITSDPEYRRGCTMVCESIADIAQESLIEQARRHNTVACIVLLKAFRPLQYNERIVEHRWLMEVQAGGEKPMLPLHLATKEELRQLKQIAGALQARANAPIDIGGTVNEAGLDTDKPRGG